MIILKPFCFSPHTLLVLDDIFYENLKLIVQRPVHTGTGLFNDPMVLDGSVHTYV